MHLLSKNSAMKRKVFWNIWQTCSFCWCTGKLLALMFSIPPPEKHSMSWKKRKGKKFTNSEGQNKCSDVCHLSKIFPWMLKKKDCEKIGLGVRFSLHSTLYWILNWQLTELAKPWRENIEFSQLLFLLYTVHTTCSYTKPHAMWYGNCTVFGWCDITHCILCQAKECLKSQPFFKFTMNYLIVGIPSNTVSIWLLKEKDIKYFKSVNKVVQMFLLTS